jgi:transcriptional regulator with XRE-family HTH domain
MTTVTSRTSLTTAFGRRARDLRNERGWTLEAMAARPGLNISAVRRAERGDDIRLSTAEKVAAAFGKSLAEMLAPELTR